FEPFFTTKEPGKGSGLGLSQVFGFAKQSGGDVVIDTRVGLGTSVKVFMPCVELIQEDREQESVDAELHPQTKPNTVILVVDDDDWVLRTTVRMIETLKLSDTRLLQPQVESKRFSASPYRQRS